MPKTKKKTKKMVDESQDLTLVSDAKFKFKKLELKETHDWHMVIEVKQILPKSYHWLLLAFDLDERPYEKRAAEVEKELTELEDNPSLLPSEDAKSVKTLKKALTKINTELRKSKNECPSFDMLVDVEQLKYKDGDTILTIRLHDTDVAMTVGRQSHRLREYLLTIEHRDIDVEGARK